MVDLDKLQAVLEQAARERQSVTYGQLLRFFGHKVTRYGVAALCRDLGQVCRRVEEAGGPDLAVLVVRQADRLPGDGYFLGLVESGELPMVPPAGDRPAVVEARQARTFEHYAS